MELTQDIVVSCPHCNQSILIEKLNCRIFRHGTLISNGEQMNPHESKENCDTLVERNLIYGCGKPFKIIDNEDGALVAVVCEYI
jgi:hypothetical protein